MKYVDFNLLTGDPRHSCNMKTRSSNDSLTSTTINQNNDKQLYNQINSNVVYDNNEGKKEYHRSIIFMIVLFIESETESSALSISLQDHLIHTVQNS